MPKVIFTSKKGLYAEAGSGVDLQQEVQLKKPLLLASSEDLADGGEASLTKSMSYFTTGGAETSTLAAGTEGLVKFFSCISHGGNMETTVTNAGWKTTGTGTITFTAVGSACMLIYVNSKWRILGKHSITVA